MTDVAYGDYLPSGRLLRCIRAACREQVRVYELPGVFIDPDLYVCGECMVPIEERPGEPQLSLEGAAGIREETRDYDPDLAQIPF